MKPDEIKPALDLLFIMKYTREHNATVLIVPDELFESQSLDNILVVTAGSIKRFRLEEMATLVEVGEGEKSPEKGTQAQTEGVLADTEGDALSLSSVSV